jgi:hypothetical protein
MEASREQVIAYRVAAQQLDRSGRTARGLAVLDIGVQDGAGEAARLAFDARLPSTPRDDLFGPDASLALVWSLRGAPYVHRRGDLARLAAALYPLSEADATQRLSETGPSVDRAGIDALDQFATAAAAMRKAVTRPTGKGAASTAITKAIPEAMRRPCRTCRTSHISDAAMRAAALAAGLELQPGTSPPVLQRFASSTLATKANPGALTRLARAYLALLGPATSAHVASYLDVRRADLEEVWPDDLVEVTIGTATTWLPSECQHLFDTAKPPELVRLLSGFDPYLQARDRELIVPTTSRHKALWPVLGRPGAVFVDGEVVGTWRPKASGRKLTIALDLFGRLPVAAREQVEAEAERVAAVRGLALKAVA